MVTAVMISDMTITAIAAVTTITAVAAIAAIDSPKNIKK